MSAPDWEFWRLRKFVKDWEAAALSIGLDPDSMKHYPQAWMAGRGKPKFTKQSFANGEQEKKFDKRYRLVVDWVREHGDAMMHFNNNDIELSAFAAWAIEMGLAVPDEFATIAQVKPVLPSSEGFDKGEEDIGEVIDSHGDDVIAGLFDPVSTSALEKMFSCGKWDDYADRAHRNQLKVARSSRRLFNPYRAALWWLKEVKPDGWDMARVKRVLANNLPPRSLDSKHIVTGELEI